MDEDLYLYGGLGLLALLYLYGRPMSALRKQILAIVAEVVPSTYPDAKFARIYPGFDPDDPNLPEHFSTCGALPSYVGRQLGYRDGITQYGTFAVRNIGQATGTWVDATPGLRPEPGDFYAVGDGGNGIVHVGVIIKSSGRTWKTADAGQGTHANQAALYVDREYDPEAVTIGGPLGPRPLAGWMNVEKYVKEHPVA